MVFFCDIISPREMKKNFMFLFAAWLCMACVGAMAANVSVKKASAVKTQEKSGLESVMSGSLLPGVIGLVQNISDLNKQQKELEAECLPTSQELRWVKKMVQEYAKAGGQNSFANDVLCDDWQYEVRVSMYTKMNPTCKAKQIEASEYVWNGYPEPEIAEYCSDSAELSGCPSSKRKKTSNVYDIFAMIDFDAEDYTQDEINMYTKFVEKTEKCAPERLKSRRKQAAAGFITNAITNAGQKTNTGTVLEAVSSMTQGGGMSGISNLLPAVTQFLDR